MDRRAYMGMVVGGGIAGCLSADEDETTDGRETPTESLTAEPSPTETQAAEFSGWMNPDEMREGFTIVHISADWEVVPPEETDDWNPDTVRRGRRGLCKRYFIYERVPEDYQIFYQGRCEDGVVITVEDGDGRVVSQIELPSKDPDAPVDDPQETPQSDA